MGSIFWLGEIFFKYLSEGRLFLVVKTSSLSEPELFLEFGFDGLLYLNVINIFRGKKE